MDKLMNNLWVNRIIALLLALLLYTSVNFEAQSDKNDNDSDSSLLNFGAQSEETIRDIPVVSYFDDDHYVVSGLPQTVTVKLIGPTADVKAAAQTKDFEVYADFTGLSLGTHKVELQYKGISDKIDVKIEPAIVTVAIQERVTKEYSVDVDFINETKIKEGYTAEQPIVKPTVVAITGAKEEIEKIAVVQALVDLKDADKTIEQQGKVAVYDINQNPLTVSVEPSVVDITVPITSPKKVVPYKITRIGKLPEGLSILSLEGTPNEVTIYGSNNVIDKIEFIDNVEVDLSKLSKDETIELPIPVPHGVTSISPSSVQIKVDVENTETRTFTNMPIESFGLAEGLALDFSEPEGGTINLDVMGAKKMLDEMMPTEIELYVDVTNFGIGDHEVDIEVNGPQNLTWVLPKKKAKITISEE